MEYLKFPKRSYYLTQGYGDDSFSHQGRYALDISAAGGGDKKIYAPFTGYVAKVYAKPGDSYSIWLVSNEKILCADNNYHYVVAMFTHPSEISQFKINDQFKVNDYILNDGSTGFSTGNHLDFEIAIYDKKEDIKYGFIKTNKGTYGLINAVDPTIYMFMDNDVKVINEYYNNKRYTFTKYNKDNKYDLGTYITMDNLYVRKGPGKEYSIKKVKELSIDGQKHATSKNSEATALYQKGTLYDAIEIINKENEVWARTYSGYVNIIYYNEENSKRLY